MVQARGGHHMKIIVTGKNITISEKIQDAIDKKFEKIGKFFALINVYLYTNTV